MFCHVQAGQGRPIQRIALTLAAQKILPMESRWGAVLRGSVLVRQETGFFIPIARNVERLRSSNPWPGCGAESGVENELRCDHAAGDAIPGVAGWVRFHVVGLGVNHQSGSAVAEHGVIVTSCVHIFV